MTVLLAVNQSKVKPKCNICPSRLNVDPGPTYNFLHDDDFKSIELDGECIWEARKGQCKVASVASIDS